MANTLLPPSDILTFTLTPDNPTNTSITNAVGETIYTVVTDRTKKSTYTQVRDVSDEVIGSLEWRDVLADRVRVGNSKPMSLWDWMKKSPVPFKDQAVFMDERGRKYKWKGLAPGLSLQLFSNDDNYGTPIARYQRSHAILDPPITQIASLSSTPSPSLLSLSPTLTDSVRDTDAQSIATTLASAETQSIAPTLVDEPRTILPRRIIKQRSPATLLLTSRAAEIQDLVVLSFLFLEKYHRTRESGSVASGNTMQGLMLAHGC
ncbi:hypothetical protein NM688_g3935 [Phlebia brevispora]|uniref:Uncharacterized protein n=1 Tax=Phlebia brevispora TaxID=194682 RepID=A0ACC1T4C6_9APHY|nr:hypothetical protein NM688_g3935 [Phlebia brevispora]